MLTIPGIKNMTTVSLLEWFHVPESRPKDFRTHAALDTALGSSLRQRRSGLDTLSN